MCRIVALACKGSACIEYGVPIVKALVKAAEHDVMLEPIVSREPRHCDGFGYALYTPSKLLVAKHDSADYLGVCREACEKNLRKLREEAESLCRELEHAGRLGVPAYLIMHARRASPREPRGSIHAHPYMITHLGRKGPKYYFLVHNGGVDKNAITRELLGERVNASLATDSNVLAEALLGGWGGEDLEEFKRRFREILSYVRTALITATLAVGVDGACIIATSYVRKDLTRARRRYYETYLVRAKHFTAVFSSTICEYLGETIPRLERKLLEGVRVIKLQRQP